MTTPSTTGRIKQQSDAPSTVFSGLIRVRLLFVSELKSLAAQKILSNYEVVVAWMEGLDSPPQSVLFGRVVRNKSPFIKFFVFFSELM